MKCRNCQKQVDKVSEISGFCDACRSVLPDPHLKYRDYSLNEVRKKLLEWGKEATKKEKEAHELDSTVRDTLF